jgi:hypothetical protein
MFCQLLETLLLSCSRKSLVSDAAGKQRIQSSGALGAWAVYRNTEPPAARTLQYMTLGNLSLCGALCITSSSKRTLGASGANGTVHLILAL